MRGEIIELFAVQAIADADFHFIEAVEHVQFGECDPGDAGDRRRLPYQHRIEPAAAALSTGDGAEFVAPLAEPGAGGVVKLGRERPRSEIGRAHSELQSLMRISYAVFCLKKKTKTRMNNRQPVQRQYHKLIK